MAFAKGASYFAADADARGLAEQAAVQARPDANDVKVYFEQAREAAETLKKDNLFVKQPPKQHPVKEVEGILGNEALIGGKWYGVGDKLQDAEIIAIRPTEITVKWEGKEKTFAPLASTRGPSSGPPSRRPEMRRPPPPGRRPGPPAQRVEVVAEAGDADELAWMGVQLPARVKAKLLEHWNSLSDEQKAEAKEKWENMSEEEKQQAVEAMEKM
jgi:hypothetical protein